MAQDSANTPAVIAGAIEYSVPQPRPVRNLPDLLRYSTEVGEMAPSPNEMKPLDEKSKEFLSAALASMTMNPSKVLLQGIEAVEQLLKAEEFTDEDCEEAFDIFLDLVENIDVANDFHKIGGFRIFTPCLSSPSDSLKWLCCEVIARLCQNNPYCQNACVSEGYLPVAVELMNAPGATSTLRIKAIYAVSCMVRENENSLLEFLKLDGLMALFRVLDTGERRPTYEESHCKRHLKAAFLLDAVSSMMSQEQKIVAVKNGFIEEYTVIMSYHNSFGDNDDVLFHLARTLLAFISDATVLRHIDIPYYFKVLRTDLQSLGLEDKYGSDKRKELIEIRKNALKILATEMTRRIKENPIPMERDSDDDY